MQEYNQTIARITSSLVNKECWYTSIGGSSYPSIMLALGKKIPRSQPLTNEYHPMSFRANDSEVSVLLWCPWRLETASEVLTTSDDTEESAVQWLSKVQNAVVSQVDIRLPSWDLTIRFRNGCSLVAFCEYWGGEPTFQFNWEFLVRPSGYSYCVEAKSTSEAGSAVQTDGNGPGAK